MLRSLAENVRYDYTFPIPSRCRSEFLVVYPTSLRCLCRSGCDLLDCSLCGPSHFWEKQWSAEAPVLANCPTTPDRTVFVTQRSPSKHTLLVPQSGILSGTRTLGFLMGISQSLERRTYLDLCSFEHLLLEHCWIETLAALSISKWHVAC